MRATALFNRMLDLPATRVVDVDLDASSVVVDVALRRRCWMRCAYCEFTAKARYDTRPVYSRWRALNVFGWPCYLRARLFRLDCPTHGVVVEAVPFARARSGFTREFEDLTAWLVTRTDKSSVCEFLQIAWRTVGRICERVVTAYLDPHRFEELVDIGVDEISWLRHHRYLTLVSNHATRKVIWGGPGKDAAALDRFFGDLGPDRAADLEAVSMDMGPAFIKSVGANAPQAAICFDPFHVVKVATDALDKLRRQVWQQLRAVPDQQAARKFKGARWALLKNSSDLTDEQRVTMHSVKKHGGALWRGYQLKEALREIFSGDLRIDQATELIGRWCSRASRSRIPEFVKAARTIRKHADGITAALERDMSNGLQEGLNNKVRLIFRRAYGFHSANAAISLILLTCGPVHLTLPHRKI